MVMVKITYRHQEAKSVNASFSICSILVMFGFFVHFQAVVDAQSVKRTNFCFYIFLQAKNQYGRHGEI